MIRQIFAGNTIDGQPESDEVVRVQWTDIRESIETNAQGRKITNREAFLIIADRVAGVWEFSERCTWDIRWYPLKPTPELISHATHLAANAKPVHGDRRFDGPGREAVVDVEVGDFYDNIEVLLVAKYRLKVGACDDAVHMLNVLRRHILAHPEDSKSHRLLLPQLEELIEAATRKVCDRNYTSQNSVKENSQEIGPGRRAKVIQESNRAMSKPEPVHLIKVRLLDAAVVVTALTWTHGLLVHDLMNLPGLEAGPVTANVLAGSALAIVLRFLLPRSL